MQEICVWRPETSLTVYVGLLKHNLTGSQALIDALFQLGLCILNKHVQELRKNLGEQMFKLFMDAELVLAYS